MMERAHSSIEEKSPSRPQSGSRTAPVHRDMHKTNQNQTQNQTQGRNSKYVPTTEDVGLAQVQLGIARANANMMTFFDMVKNSHGLGGGGTPSPASKQNLERLIRWKATFRL
ncbi:hypothetical protein HK102_006134 [Quaeritorhiza haematococci]|nr:hypothetical protein HK102_006134 [Quaeritorhiza haematococci]